MDITYQSVALILKLLKVSEGQAAVDLVELHGIPQDMESVDALIHKKDDRVRKEFEKWAIQLITMQEILDGARMNLPLMEEVTKKAQKVKQNNQAGLFSE